MVFAVWTNRCIKNRPLLFPLRYVLARIKHKLLQFIDRQSYEAERGHRARACVRTQACETDWDVSTSVSTHQENHNHQQPIGVSVSETSNAAYPFNYFKYSAGQSAAPSLSSHLLCLPLTVSGCLATDTINNMFCVWFVCVHRHVIINTVSVTITPLCIPAIL